ncbi:MAG: Flp family type IVb pilin [Pseudomonadota bacterium]
MIRAIKFLRDENGSTAIEYGLIAALIGTVIIVGISNVGSSTDAMYNNITDTIAAATS